jgi:phage I-like protein
MQLGSIFFSLNAEGGKAPARVQLLPPGPVVKGRDGRTWLCSDPAAVLVATAAREVDLAVDINHSTDLQAPLGADAPAVGWLRNVALNEAGEVWADADWTDEGKALIEGRRYRYLSPVFKFDPQSMEIEALIGASLCNRPNLRLQALNSESAPDGQSAGTKEEVSMKALCAALGLPETATEGELVQAVSAIKAKAPAPAASAATAVNAQSVDLTAYAPRADLALMEQRALNAEGRLQTLKVEDLKKRAEAAVDAAIKDRKIAPASKDAYLAMCASEEGLRQFGEIVKVAPAVIPERSQGAVGDPPAGDAALNAEELATAKELGYSPEAWKKVKEAAK